MFSQIFSENVVKFHVHVTWFSYAGSYCDSGMYFTVIEHVKLMVVHPGHQQSHCLYHGHIVLRPVFWN